MDYSKVVYRPEKTNILNSKFVSRKKSDESGKAAKYKARFVLYGNEKSDSEDGSFSPAADFTIIKLIICAVVQRKRSVSHHVLQRVFQNGLLEGPVYVKLPTQIKDVEQKRTHILRLRRSLYVLETL